MPFIRGRYHMNPIVGQAIEAAREAEAARLARNGQGSQNDPDSSEDGYGQADDGQAERGPIHRVEIEAAEMVPAHTGRAQRGYVARVHREDTRGGAAQTGGAPPTAAATRSETHVFSGHRDLVTFLRDEFAKECAGK
jgi:hypothetical protein